MNYKKYIVAVGAIMLWGCADHDDWMSGNRDTGNGEIKISGDINQQYTTRVNDGGFVNGDAIGLYVVDYVDGAAGTLASSGNHANNVKFTFNEDDYSWSGSAKLYWNDNETHVDAYSYYPFTDYIEDVSAYPFTVERRQDKDTSEKNAALGGYEASDFLWAKAADVEPKTTIQLNHQHVMASVQLTLVEGDGFNGTWDNLDKTVLVMNTREASTVNLSTGTVSVDETSDITPITPYKQGEDYRCVVVPQTVAAETTLISISIDEDSYNFTRSTAMTYQPGKLHKFTIKVDCRAKGDYLFTLVDEAVTPWEADGVSHQAEARVYTVVDVPEAGGLEAAVNAAGLTPSNVENLKLTGTMNETDFSYLSGNFGNLLALNLKELRTVDISLVSWRYGGEPGYGIFEDNRIIDWESDRFDDALPCCMAMSQNGGGGWEGGLSNLQHIVLPDHLKYIGAYALSGTPLTGSLVIPDGVIWIGSGFIGSYGSNSHHITNLTLPNSVKYIGGWAFGNGDLHPAEFTNELILPDSIEYIGDMAFGNCKNTYGTVHLPQTLKYIGGAAFCGVPLTGSLVYPAGTTIIHGAFSGTDITSVYIPDGVEEIGSGAFNGCDQLRGDISIPNSVKKIGGDAFLGTGFNHVKLPENLEIIETNLLRDCKNLIDTLTVPEGVIYVNYGAFYGCSNLDAIILPSTLEIMGGHVFDGCSSLSYLQCDAKIPPTVESETFQGLNMTNFTLVVPEGCVEAYQNADGWKEFKRISEYKNLVFRPQLAKVLNKGGERSVVLNADADKSWTVTSCPDWMHISATSGKGKTELTITIDAMEHGSEDRVGEIEVQLEGTDYTTTFKATQFDYEYDEDEGYTMQEHSKGNGIDLVIVGDGYDAEDIANGTYLSHMMETAEYFFDVEPYKTYKEYFNVYTAFAMSYESGIGSVYKWRETKFQTSYGNGSYDSRISTLYDQVAYYCLDNTPVEEANFGKLTCILTANGDGYDGVTALYGNGTAVAICPRSASPYPNDARGLVQHEAGGHGFGKLADEYVYHKAYIQSCSCTCCAHVAGLQSGQDVGWYMNLSLSGKTADLPWKHLMKDSRMSDIADVWEGGWYHSRGVYRSEYNSCMNNNVPYYSTWSRELIVRRIMDYAGETYDYETFVANDSRDWGQDFTLGTRAKEPSAKTTVKQGQAPIIVKGAPQRGYKKVRKH